MNARTRKRLRCPSCGSVKLVARGTESVRVERERYGVIYADGRVAWEPWEVNSEEPPRDGTKRGSWAVCDSCGDGWDTLDLCVSQARRKSRRGGAE